MRKVIFFDRDGTLIEDKIYLNDPENIIYLEGVFQGMKMLQDKGFEFIVVTNQSGVPRGLVQVENLEKIHENIKNDFAAKDINVLGFYYAPYLVESNHEWRKPNPGMLNQGVKDFDVDRSQSWMVGDRMTDVEAGRRAEMRSIFLHGTEDPKDSEHQQAEFEAQNFLELSRYIIKQSSTA